MNNIIEYLNWWSQSDFHVLFGLIIHGSILSAVVYSIESICGVGMVFAKRNKNKEK